MQMGRIMSMIKAGQEKKEVEERKITEKAKEVNEMKITEKMKEVNEMKITGEAREVKEVKTTGEAEEVKETEGITYSKQGDYLIPDLLPEPEEELPLGRYALMHRDHLENHRKADYINLLTTGRLTAYLYGVEQTALGRLERTTRQLASEQGVTEEMKEKDQIRWVQMMNGIRSQAEEMIMKELIYN